MNVEFKGFLEAMVGTQVMNHVVNRTVEKKYWSFVFEFKPLLLICGLTLSLAL